MTIDEAKTKIAKDTHEDMNDSYRGEEMYELFNFFHEHRLSYRKHLGNDMFELGLAERISENTNPYDN